MQAVKLLQPIDKFRQECLQGFGILEQAFPRLLDVAFYVPFLFELGIILRDLTPFLLGKACRNQLWMLLLELEQWIAGVDGEVFLQPMDGGFVIRLFQNFFWKLIPVLKIESGKCSFRMASSFCKNSVRVRFPFRNNLMSFC